MPTANKKDAAEPLVLHSFTYRDGRPVVFPARTRSRKPLPRADSFSDFRIGIDRIVRFDGRTFFLDGEGTYAPVEVRSDVLDDAGRANLDKLTPPQAAQMAVAVALSCWLSDEGKRERLEHIRERHGERALAPLAVRAGAHVTFTVEAT